MSTQAGEKKRFFWKKDVKYDLELLNAVESLNPFSVTERKAGPIWKEIAKLLQEGPLKMDVNERSCKDRVSNLLEPFKKEEALSMLQSGVAEGELTEVRRLLTNVAALEKDREHMKSNKAYNIEKRKNAEEIRNKAIKKVELKPCNDGQPQEDKTLEKSDQDESNSLEAAVPSPSSSDSAKSLKSEVDPVENEKTDSDSSSSQSVKSDTRKRSNVKDEVLEMMKTKFAKAKETEDLSLKVRLLEAQNRSKELEIQKDKESVELAERRRMNDLMFMFFQNQLKGVGTVAGAAKGGEGSPQE